MCGTDGQSHACRDEYGDRSGQSDTESPDGIQAGNFLPDRADEFGAEKSQSDRDAGPANQKAPEGDRYLRLDGRIAGVGKHRGDGRQRANCISHIIGSMREGQERCPKDKRQMEKPGNIFLLVAKRAGQRTDIRHSKSTRNDEKGRRDVEDTGQVSLPDLLEPFHGHIGSKRCCHDCHENGNPFSRGGEFVLFKEDQRFDGVEHAGGNKPAQYS